MTDIKKSKNLNLAYFISTLVFFSVQLKIVIDAFYFGRYSVTVIFLSLLFLKLGELINELVVIDSTKLFSVLSAMSLPVIFYGSGIFLFAGCFVFGLSMMKVRDMTIHHSSRRMKFTARAIGFILSPVLPYSYLVVLGIIAMLTVLSCRIEKANNSSSFRWYDGSSGRAGNWSMGLHHFHYFSYAYSVPIVYQLYTDLNFVWLGLVFYIGWAAYNAYERFVRPSWMLIFTGHIIAALSLIMLAGADSIPAMTFWWFMTGLGGGTVYMIQPLVCHTNNTITELKISEGFGHVFGILAWGGLISFCGVKATFLAGALGGAAVASIALYKIISLGSIHLRKVQ